MPTPDINQVLTGDCLELLSGVIDVKPDLVVTDPPYDFEKKHPVGGGFFIPQYMAHFDKIESTYGFSFDPMPFIEIIDEVMPKLNLYVWCNKRLLPIYLNWAEDKGYIWDIINWYKPNAVPVNKGHYLIDKEYCVFVREKGSYFDSSLGYEKYRTVISFPIGGKKETEHPNEKPLEILGRMIEISCPPGGLVLDPYCGSGSTCLAARQLRRNYLGIEIDPRYADMARRRLDGFGQLELFGGAA